MPTQASNFKCSGLEYRGYLVQSVATPFRKRNLRLSFMLFPHNAQLNMSSQIKITKYTRKQVSRKGNQKENQVPNHQVQTM